MLKMTMWKNVRVFLLLSLGLIPVLGCQGTIPSVNGDPAVGGGWVLQFTDNFERGELGDNWRVVSGTWSVENERLLCKQGKGVILCAKNFPGSQRLEFDAASDDPCDLSGLLCTDDLGHRNGYFFGFGSDNNVHSKLLISGVAVKTYDQVITPSKIHHVVCQREGNLLTHIMDGAVVMNYIHHQPLSGERHEKVGFYIYTSGMIDNVKVYTKPEN